VVVGPEGIPGRTHDGHAFRIEKFLQEMMIATFHVFPFLIHDQQMPSLCWGSFVFKEFWAFEAF
jgi:hypothetical protein